MWNVITNGGRNVRQECVIVLLQAVTVQTGNQLALLLLGQAVKSLDFNMTVSESPLGGAVEYHAHQMRPFVDRSGAPTNKVSMYVGICNPHLADILPEVLDYFFKSLDYLLRRFLFRRRVVHFDFPRGYREHLGSETARPSLWCSWLFRCLSLAAWLRRKGRRRGLIELCVSSVHRERVFPRIYGLVPGSRQGVVFVCQPSP